jgi:hypothetical protein
VHPTATRASTKAAVRLALAHNVEELETTGRDHATVLAREAAADGIDALVVLAGDGTVNEAANGLLDSDTALAVIPAGSTNVFARWSGGRSATSADVGGRYPRRRSPWRATSTSLLIFRQGRDRPGQDGGTLGGGSPGLGEAGRRLGVGDDSWREVTVSDVGDHHLGDRQPSRAGAWVARRRTSASPSLVIGLAM